MPNTITNTETINRKARYVEAGDKITREGGLPLLVKSVLTYHDSTLVPGIDYVGFEIEGLGIIFIKRNEYFAVTREVETTTFEPGTIVATQWSIWRRTDKKDEWRSTYLRDDFQQDRDADLSVTDSSIERWLSDESYGVKLIHTPSSF